MDLWPIYTLHTMLGVDHSTEILFIHIDITGNSNDAGFAEFINNQED